jgi:hypothetical protein
MDSRRLTGKWYLKKKFFGFDVMAETIQTFTCEFDLSPSPELTIWEKAKKSDFLELGVMTELLTVNNIKMSAKLTKVIDTDYQKLTVLGSQMIQVQIEQDDQDAYIDINRAEARELARILVEHCNESEK